MTGTMKTVAPDCVCVCVCVRGVCVRACVRACVVKQKPDMSKLVSDAGKLRLLDTLLPKLKAGGHKVGSLAPRARS